MQPDSPRRSVDLTAYPDLIVVYLGIRLRGWRGALAMLQIGSGLAAIRRDPPDGLLRDEGLLYGWGHFGMRQYWRDLESLERFTRSDPHKQWWRSFAKGGAGAGFWHETYRKQGGMEAVYIDTPPIGFAAFAESRPPVGPFLSARERLAA
jgi:hypothetical protein